VVKLARAVFDSIRAYKPNLIHSHGFTSALASVLPSTILHVPHVMTAHDIFQVTQFVGWKGSLKRAAVGRGLSLLSGIHCVTADAASNLFEFFPGLRGAAIDVQTIPHGVDVQAIVSAEARDLRQELRLRDDTTLFGFLGRFMAQKGFRYLIDAIELLAQQGSRSNAFKVLAVGSGGFLQEEQRRIEQSGLTDFFVFWPYQPNIASILKGLDCLVMPSLWEASGLLAMEAFVAGTSVIGTNCIGLRETLVETPAIVARPGDSESLAEAMRTLMNDGSARVNAKVFQAVAMERFDSRRAFATLREFLDRQLGAGSS